MIVLVGFMGAGKSTVARLLAARLGVPYTDTDALIESAAGKPIAEMFTTDGEDAFRSLERRVVSEVLSGGRGVVSLGGGAVVDPQTRGLLAGHTVVHLEVSLEEALKRLGGDNGRRPLLRDANPGELFEQRKSVYRDASAIGIDTNGRAPAEVVDELLATVAGTRPTGGGRVTVWTNPRPYDVVIGRGLVGDPGSHLALPEAAANAFVLTHPSLLVHAERLATGLRSAGLDPAILTIPEGEGSKSLDVAGHLLEELAALRAHRNDILFSVGGGVVCDVGGFVASTYMRGLAHVAIPTSLLAQVDAAIGGKTGVNLGSAKNLVGTIHQPLGVLCDVDLLSTCPPEEIRSGLAEVLKAGFIADPTILENAKGFVPEQGLDPDLATDLIARSVAVKASIVASDERERGDRAFLNYGHTFAHAIETVSGLGSIRHGDAVAIGMVAAAYTARGLGWISDPLVDLHRDSIARVGLPTRANLVLEDLEAAWTQDKKYSGGVRFVLLRDLAQPEAGVSVPRPVLEDALARLARED